MMNIRNLMRTMLRRFHGGTSIFVSPSAAGIYVNEEIALTYAPFWDAVRCISDSIAMLPWRLYEKKGKARSVRDDLDLDWLLYVQPNSEQSAFQFKQFLLASALTWGNGYAEIERDAGLRPIALWPLLPHTVTPMRENVNGKLIYRVNDGQNDAIDLPTSDVLHLPGLGYDGLIGYSVARMAARTISTGLGMDVQYASLMANGSMPSGLLTTEAILNEKQIEMQRKNWEDVHKGPARAGKTAIMFGGIKWQSTTMPLVDAQFIESRKWGVREIARWFRLPPHKLGDLTDAKYANIEQQAIEFVTDCLMPWIVNLEQIANIKLVGRNNRGRLYTKINVNALLRGDFQARSAAYKEGIQNAWLSPNDVRELEDMNPTPGKAGDMYYMQSQMIPIELLTEKIKADIEKTKNPPTPQVQPTGPDTVPNQQADNTQTQNLVKLMLR